MVKALPLVPQDAQEDAGLRGLEARLRLRMWPLRILMSAQALMGLVKALHLVHGDVDEFAGFSG